MGVDTLLYSKEWRELEINDGSQETHQPLEAFMRPTTHFRDTVSRASCQILNQLASLADVNAALSILER